MTASDYNQSKIDQYGSWDLYLSLTKLELNISNMYWSLIDSAIESEIRRSWLWESIYESAYSEGGSLWLGSYYAVIMDLAESFDYGDDSEYLQCLCDSIEEAYRKIAESYAGVIDYDEGMVYFLTEVDTP